MPLPEGDWVNQVSPHEREAFVREELLDVVVGDVGPPQWQSLLDHVRDRYACSFVVAGKVEPVPATAIQMLATPRIYPLGLRIRVGNLSINEYFLDEGKIEFDMSPMEIADVSDIDAFLSFVKGVGDSVHREVVVRVEGSHDERGVVFRFTPGDPRPRSCSPHQY